MRWELAGADPEKVQRLAAALHEFPDLHFTGPHSNSAQRAGALQTLARSPMRRGPIQPMPQHAT